MINFLLLNFIFQNESNLCYRFDLEDLGLRPFSLFRYYGSPFRLVDGCDFSFSIDFFN